MIRRIQSRKGPGWSDFYKKGIRLFQARIVSAGSSRISATSRRGRCPRTITLRPETLQNLIYDVTASLIRMGFTHVVFMNNHDPNQLILNHVLQCIRKDFGLVMPSLWPTNMAHSFGQELFADAKRVLIHRNEPSTSLMLALCPKKVRMDLAAESPRDYGKLGEIPYGSSQRLVFRGIKVPLFARVSDVFQTGGYGKPKAASAEIGREILARMAEYTSAFIEEFLKTDNALGK